VISRRFFLSAAIAALSMLASAEAAALEGRVVDAVTGSGIAGATVTVGEAVTATDGSGHFAIPAQGVVVMARAPGYRAASTKVAGALQTLPLAPFRPKALYLSFYGIGDRPLRKAALDLIHAKLGLNALVIEIKDERGLVAYRSGVPEVHEIGADRVTTIPDLPALLSRLHGDGIYTIARIVVFDDDRLATARPELGIRNARNGLFRDRAGLRWTDPFRRDVWAYDIAIAVEAARAGFDEIQFDYVRFPDAKGLVFSEPSTMASRIGAITGFLQEARRRLAAYNVFLAVDVFGYICWNLDDTGIGQLLEDIVPLVDYVSPMLYPSGFQFGIPGFRNPVEHPYEIVRNSLDNALARTHVSPLRFRPWLQAFKDYAFDRRAFGGHEIEAQLRAATIFGSGGWMLWNPRNVYPGEVLRAVLGPSLALRR
jgi:hypothetical protein